MYGIREKLVLSAMYPEYSLIFKQSFCAIFSKVLADTHRHALGLSVAENLFVFEIKGHDAPTLCWKPH